MSGCCDQNTLSHPCVSAEEYQRLAEQLDRLRESYGMVYAALTTRDEELRELRADLVVMGDLLREVTGERDRARDLAALLEAELARVSS